MQSAPIRLVALASTLALVVGVAACGQLTGLSDDYQFDLVDGGAASKDGAADSPGIDAASADSAAQDSAVACTSAQTMNAADRLSQDNGTEACKTCLATSCCVDVETCARATDCNRVLACKLDCTDRASAERAQCFRQCNNSGGGVPALYTAGVGACSTAACAQECAFQ